MTSNSGVDTEDKVFCYDFATQGWTTRACVGSADVSNFVESFDGVYFFKHSDNKIHLVSNDQGTENIDLRTKDIDFGNPGLVKRVNRVFVTAKGNGTNLTLSYANDGESSYQDLSAQTLGTEYAIKEFTINTADRNCESMAFKITANGSITINDINIDYRQNKKRRE